MDFVMTLQAYQKKLHIQMIWLRLVQVPTLIQDVFLTILFLNNREAAQMAQLNNRAVEATEIGLVATLQTKEVPNKFDCVWWFN